MARRPARAGEEQALVGTSATPGRERGSGEQHRPQRARTRWLSGGPCLLTTTRTPLRSERRALGSEQLGKGRRSLRSPSRSAGGPTPVAPAPSASLSACPTSACAKLKSSPAALTTRAAAIAVSRTSRTTSSDLPEAAASVGRSKSRPITAATDSTRTASTPRRATRWTMTVRAFIGRPCSSMLPHTDQWPSASHAITPVSMRCRRSSPTKNGFPSVSLSSASRSAAVSRSAASPVLCSRSADSSVESRPRSSTRVTPASRCSQAKRSSNGPPGATSEVRYVPTTTRATGSSDPTRYRNSCRLGTSPQWRSSRTTTSRAW